METNRSIPDTTNAGRVRKRRVSQRRELTAVTLGMVASIAGVGGLLASGQAQSQPANNASQSAARSASPNSTRSAPASPGYSGGAVQQSSQVNGGQVTPAPSQSPPSWSGSGAASQPSTPVVSQGS